MAEQRIGEISPSPPPPEVGKISSHFPDFFFLRRIVFSHDFVPRENYTLFFLCVWEIACVECATIIGEGGRT